MDCQRPLVAMANSNPALPAPITTTRIRTTGGGGAVVAVVDVVCWTRTRSSKVCVSCSKRDTKAEMGRVGKVYVSAPGVVSKPRLIDPISIETASNSNSIVVVVVVVVPLFFSVITGCTVIRQRFGSISIT